MSKPIAASRRHLLGGSVRVFFGEALAMPTGLLATAFLTRRLGPGGYGEFIVAATLVAWIGWSISALFGRATFKLLGQADDWQPIGIAVVRLHLAFGSLAALLLWAGAGIAATMLKEPALAGLLRLYALEIPLFSLAQAHRNVLVGIGAFRERAIAAGCRWVSRLALIVAFVQMGLGVRGAVLGSIGSCLVELACCRYYVQPAFFGRTDFSPRELWRCALPLLLCTASMFALDKLDLFMLQALGGGVEQAGFYGAARSVTLVPGLFTLSFGPLLLRTLSQMLHTGQTELARRTARDALRLVAGMLPFAAIGAGASLEIVVTIFGPAFRPAAAPMAVLIFGCVPFVAISVSISVLIAAGRFRSTVWVTAPLVFAAAAGNLWFIPHMGMLGAALVMSLVCTTGALAAVLTVRRTCGATLPLPTLARSLAIAAAVYTLTAVWPVAGLLPVALKLSAIAILILPAFALLGEFDPRERLSAYALFRRRAQMSIPPCSA